MRVLGICDGHDAGAALVADGRVVAAVSEERLTRRKRQPGFPFAAVQACLDLGNVPPWAIDRVAVAERHGRGVHRALDRFYRRADPNRPMHRPTNRASMAWQNGVAAAWPAARLDAALSARAVAPRLRRLGVHARAEFVDHHDAHAWSAARGSGFDAALVVTMDAFGDGASATVHAWRDRALTPLVRVPYPHGPALLYGMVTSFLGFVEGDEGKVAGLAAKGDPTAARGRLAGLLGIEHGAPRLRAFPSRARLARRLAGIPREDVAAGVQARVEDVAARFVGHWRARTGLDRLALAGGLFANVRLNQVVAERTDAADLYVFPHMGDGGLCVGAAWAVDPGSDADPMPSVFLGPDAEPFDPAWIAGEAVDVRPLDGDAIARIAALLHAGEAVAVVRGRLEFGPRALGGRSLLFSAASPERARRIGDALARPSLMPFAPVVRAEDFHRVADGPMVSAVRHMTATATARGGVAEKFPVAVHADGTMRVQVVTAADAPLLHAVLTACARHADPPVLINTSYNLHEEPIVAATRRAVELLLRLPVRALVARDLLLEKRG